MYNQRKRNLFYGKLSNTQCRIFCVLWHSSNSTRFLHSIVKILIILHLRAHIFSHTIAISHKYLSIKINSNHKRQKLLLFLPSYELFSMLQLPNSERFPQVNYVDSLSDLFVVPSSICYEYIYIKISLLISFFSLHRQYWLFQMSYTNKDITSKNQ